MNLTFYPLGTWAGAIELVAIVKALRIDLMVVNIESSVSRQLYAGVGAYAESSVSEAEGKAYDGPMIFYRNVSFCSAHKHQTQTSR